MQRSVRFVWVLLLTAACSKAAPDSSPKTAAEKAPSPAKTAEPPKDARPAEPPKTVPAVPGAALRDPPWFRPGIFPGASVQKTGRSEADEQGRFASQLLLELPEGTGVDACIATVEKAIAPHVPGFARVDDTSAGPGRVMLRGATEHYEVTVVCGEAKGRVRAFLNYRWTKLPEGVTPPAGGGAGGAGTIR